VRKKMVKSWWISLLASPAVFGMTLVFSATAIAHNTGIGLVGATPIKRLGAVWTPAASSALVFSTAAATKFKPLRVANLNLSTLPLAVMPAIESNQPNLAKTDPVVAVTPKQQLVADQSAAPATSSLAQAPNIIDQVVRESKGDNDTQNDPMSQVTSVSQLRDVQPTDWAFQALQSLVERYGVIAGYPNGTFRGNRALTRYEFAAGLKAALDRVNELLASGSANLVRKEDIAILQRLQQEFSTELTALRGRVDNLEAQTAQLEANQFSTTTKLVGEAVFNVISNFGNYHNDNTVFEDRVRLDLQTSFFGKDTLHTRLVAGNAQRLNHQNQIAFGGPNGPFVTYEGEGSSTLLEEPNTFNGVGLDWLSYYYPILGNSSQIYVVASGGLTGDIVPPGNPYFNDGDGGTAALSLFAQENPIFRIGGGSGAGINVALGKAGTLLGATSISAVYLADNALNPSPKAGLFNGDFVAMGELNVNFNDRFGFAATYAHAYNTAGSGIFNNGGPGSLTSPFLGAVGTAQANDPSILLPGGQRSIITNSYGGEFTFRPSDKISLSGFIDETNARILGRGDGNIWTYALGLAFPDLGKQGNVLGLVAGVEPTLRGLRAVGVPRNFGRRDNAYHFEGFYKYQLTDYISITPGLIVLTAPGQNIRNNDVFIGTLRTTFTF